MDTLRAPNLDSFESAKHWFTHTPPIRGHKDKVRPLGVRRYHQRGSIAMPDDDTVTLHYYRQSFVQWKSDNTFTVSFPYKYVTAYSIDDMCGFVPHGMWFEWKESRAIISFREGVEVRSYVMEQGDVFQFSITGSRSFQLHNKKREFKYAKRRGVVPKIVDERYGAFLDWATVITGVDGKVSRDEAEEALQKMHSHAGLPSFEEVGAFRNFYERLYEESNYYTDVRNMHHLPYSRGRDGWFHTRSCEVLDSWLTGEPEQWVSALHVIAKRGSWYEWRNHYYMLTMPQVRTVVNNIAMHLFRNEVFAEVELPDGVVPPRTNRRYFKTVTIRDIPTLRRPVQPNV